MGNPTAGFRLIVVILFLGGAQLLARGVIGGFLGRIYEESKQRSIYLIRACWESSDRARPPRDRGNPGA
jgi:hypothetical protein